jgi:copper chaperone CopZ
MKKIKLAVRGMHCASCETLLKDSLEEAGAKALEISSRKGMAVIEYDEKKLDESAIRSIIKKKGYVVS